MRRRLALWSVLHLWAALLTASQFFLWTSSEDSLLESSGNAFESLNEGINEQQLVNEYQWCGKKSCLSQDLQHPLGLIDLRHDDHRVLSYLKREIEAPPDVNSNGLDPRNPPWDNITSYKAIEQNIRSLFDNIHHGTFVEVGAQDGLWLSNTWWLESALGWRGLLVETDPNNYHSLRSSPRRSFTLPACVVPGFSVQEEKVLGMKQLDILDSVIGMNQKGRTMLAKYSTPTDLYLGEAWNTTCFPLMSILAASGYKTINLLVLDIAGGGFELMEDFLLSNDEIGNPFRVQVILYQDRESVNSDRIAKDVKDFGYQHVTVANNHYLLIHHSMSFAVT